MLALAHVLEPRGWPTGIPRALHGRLRALPPYLMGESDGQPKSPEWAAAICGVPTPSDPGAGAADGRRRRTLITLSWSLQRGRARRAAVLDGGGARRDARPDRPAGRRVRLRLRRDRRDRAVAPSGCAARPCRRAEPGRDVHPGCPDRRHAAATRASPTTSTAARCTYPDIRLVYWAGGNPFHHHQDLERLPRGWRGRRRSSSTSRAGPPPRKRADIVLPATTHLERDDIGARPRRPLCSPCAADPAGRRGARRLRDLVGARRAGSAPGRAFTEGRTAADWIASSTTSIAGWRPRRASRCRTSTSFGRGTGSGCRSRPGPNRTLFAPFRDDPGGGTAEDAVGQDRDLLRRRSTASATTTARAIRSGCRRGNGSARRRRPRRCTSFRRSPATSCTASSRARSPTCRARGRKRILIHPDDAAARGIGDGDLVRVFNARGACRARARVSDSIRPGVVALPTGAWFGDPGGNLDPHGNPNVLTLDVGTSRLAQGSSAHTALVEVARLDA